MNMNINDIQERKIQTILIMISSCLHDMMQNGLDEKEKLKFLIKMYKKIHESLPLFITQINRFKPYFRTILIKTPHLLYETTILNAKNLSISNLVECIQIMMKVQDSINRILADKNDKIIPLPHFMKELEPVAPIAPVCNGLTEEEKTHLFASEKHEQTQTPNQVRRINKKPLFDNNLILDKTNRKRIARFPTLLGNQASKAYN